MPRPSTRCWNPPPPDMWEPPWRLLQKLRDGLAVAGGDGLAIAVDAAGHELLAGDPHAVHQVAVAAEDPAVDEVGVVRADELRRLHVQGQRIALAIEAGGVAAAVAHRLQQAFSDARRGRAGDDVATPGGQPLAILQPAQLLHR